MSEPVYVIQSIYDGAQGAPYDEILSIAVCRVDLEAGTIDVVLDGTVKADTRSVGKVKLDYAEARGLNVPSLFEGTPLPELAESLRDVVKGCRVTSYDTEQQFSKYLLNDPWNLTTLVTVLPPISGRQPISLRCKRPEDETDRIVKAYKKAYRNDPLQIGKARGAVQLARMSSKVMLSLYERGKYKLP